MTESTTLQKLQLSNEQQAESLDIKTEIPTEIATEQLGNEVKNAEIPANLETHPWESPEFKDDSNIKGYKELASKYGVSVDTVRKDLKKIATICEELGASYNLTRKEGRKVLVTAEGQCELCKYRELGADAYRQSIEAFWGTPEVRDEPELESGFDREPQQPQEPVSELTVRDDRADVARTQSQQQSAIAQQGANLAHHSEIAANHQDEAFANQLQTQEMQGVQEGATLALQRHAGKLEGYHRTLDHLDQSFLTRTIAQPANPNTSGLQDFVGQVGKSPSPPKTNSGQFLDDLLGQFQ